MGLEFQGQSFKYHLMFSSFGSLNCHLDPQHNYWVALTMVAERSSMTVILCWLTVYFGYTAKPGAEQAAYSITVQLD